MKEVNSKEKILLSTISVIVFISVIFSLAFIRPVLAEKKVKQEELNTVEVATADYEKLLAALAPQVLTPEEQRILVEGIPVRPNAVQVIKDLESIEKGTEAFIQSISFSDSNSGQEQTEQANEVEVDQWSELFSPEMFTLLEKSINEVNKVTISYIDVQISLKGNETNINNFINSLEKLPRIVHVQNYNYTLNSEDNTFTGVISARVFYSEDFGPFVTKAPIKETSQKDVENDKSKEEVVEETKPEEPKKEESVKRYATEIVMDSSSVKITMDSPPVEGEGNGFYLVQTGAYTSDFYLLKQVDQILAKGIAPRVSDSSISLIFSSVSHDIPSAAQKAKTINQMGIETYIMPLRINLSAEEKQWLLPAAQQVLADIASITTSGLTNAAYIMPEEQKTKVTNSITQLEKEVTNRLESMDEKRKTQLQNTVTIVKEIESILTSYQTEKSIQSLWKIDGLLIDYTLNLNGNMVHNK